MTNSPSSSHDGTPRPLFYGSCGLFGAMLLLGGGGSPAPLMQAALEAIAFLWLLYLAWVHLFARPLPAEARLPSLFLLAIFLIPALHLLPLPYGIWSNLPGREIPVEAVRLAGLGEPWMPLSLIPEATRIGALQLVPAAAVFFSTYALAPRDRVALAKIALAVATLSAIIGAFQFAAPGTRSLYLFSRSAFDVPSGLFANRNFQAALLIQGILLCALQVRLAQHARRDRAEPGGWRNLPPAAVGAAMVIPLLALLALATQSRTAVILLPPALIIAFVVGSNSPLRKAAMLGGGAVMAFAAVILALQPPFVRTLLGRFLEADVRAEAWADLRHISGLYAPVGSGIGTFDPVFRAGESLSFVQWAFFNHAHNDYWEILIEAGIPGVVLIALFLAAYAWRSLRVLRSGRKEGYAWLQRVAAVGILFLLVHSTNDYPLRTISLQCLFAFYCALLFSGTPAERRRRP